MLPDDTRAVLDARRWPLPPVFRWLAGLGGVAPAEMLRVFNCGVGMALVVTDAPAALALLADQGETAWEIGRVEVGAGEPEAHIAVPPDWLA